MMSPHQALGVSGAGPSEKHVVDHVPRNEGSSYHSTPLGGDDELGELASCRSSQWAPPPRMPSPPPFGGRPLSFPDVSAVTRRKIGALAGLRTKAGRRGFRELALELSGLTAKTSGGRLARVLRTCSSDASSGHIGCWVAGRSRHEDGCQAVSVAGAASTEAELIAKWSPVGGDWAN